MKIRLLLRLSAALFVGSAVAQSPKPSVPKWEVSHQLIVDLPWNRATQTEATLQADVKEAEATPDQRLVFALENLGGWYRDQKKYPEAERTYQRVLKLQTDRLGEHHDVALAHNDLGVVYTESGRFPEAETEFKKALDLWTKKWEQELRTEDEAVTMHNYSVLLEKLGRGADAKAMEEKALAIIAARKKAFGIPD